MSTAPRLSIGLPIFNSATYLPQSLDALLGQSYSDFELIISDNASTDETEEICRDYASHDPRIRYIRQDVNIGAGPNHNAVFYAARGELFKWASDDDLYGRDLLWRCVEMLDEHPDVVLTHSRTAMIDEQGRITRVLDYPLRTHSRDAAERFASLLFDVGGDDDYGVVRSSVLRRVAMYDSYWHSDRTLVAEIALHGRFHHVPESLYFRRDHPGRSVRANRSVRTWCANMDPRRANRIVHPVPRLLAEYVWAYVAAIQRAPLDARTRRRCLGHLARWLARRSVPRQLGSVPEIPAEAVLAEKPSISELVPGRRRST